MAALGEVCFENIMSKFRINLTNFDPSLSDVTGEDELNDDVRFLTSQLLDKSHR